MMMTRMARTMTTSSGPCISSSAAGAGVAGSLGPHVQRQAFLAADAAALAGAQRLLADVLHGPLRPAQLGFADRPRRQVLDGDGDLPLQRVDLGQQGAADIEALQERAPEEQQGYDREH